MIKHEVIFLLFHLFHMSIFITECDKRFRYKGILYTYARYTVRSHLLTFYNIRVNAQKFNIAIYLRTHKIQISRNVCRQMIIQGSNTCSRMLKIYTSKLLYNNLIDWKRYIIF